ncbi:MAG: hypothetical protein HXS47_12940 [Theionarchaea archaeon]|nr:hypothetical protein [Theionarchaea archaeon]
MNDEQKKNQSFFLRFMDLIEQLQNDKGVKKTEIKKKYSEVYEKISPSRTGGAVDILLDLGFLSYDQRTGLFQLSSIAKRFLNDVKNRNMTSTELMNHIIENI